MPIWLRLALKLTVVVISLVLSYNTGVEIERARQPARAFDAIRNFLQGVKKPVPVAPVPVATPTATKPHRPFRPRSLLGAGEPEPLEPLTVQEALQLLKLAIEEPQVSDK